MASSSSSPPSSSSLQSVVPKITFPDRAIGNRILIQWRDDDSARRVFLVPPELITSDIESLLGPAPLLDKEYKRLQSVFGDWANSGFEYTKFGVTTSTSISVHGDVACHCMEAAKCPGYRPLARDCPSTWIGSRCKKLAQKDRNARCVCAYVCHCSQDNQECVYCKILPTEEKKKKKTTQTEEEKKNKPTTRKRDWKEGEEEEWKQGDPDGADSSEEESAKSGSESDDDQPGNGGGGMIRSKAKKQKFIRR